MSRRAGVSLMELLIALTLVIVVGFLLFQLFVPSLWLFQRQQAASQAHQVTLLISQRMVKSLSNTLVETTTISHRASQPVPVCFSYVEVLGYSASTATYQLDDKFTIVFFQPQSKTLSLWKWRPGDPGPSLAAYNFAAAEPPCLSGTDLESLADYARQHKLGRVVARDLVEFDLADHGGGAGAQLVLPLSLKARVEVQTGSHLGPKSETSYLETKFSPRVFRW